MHANDRRSEASTLLPSTQRTPSNVHGQPTNGAFYRIPSSGSSTTDDDEPIESASVLVASMGGIFLYFSIGVLVYTAAGMNLLEAMYFCMVTLTTVGYGDLSAHSTSTKLFSCVYILVGVALIGALLSKLVEAVLDNQERIVLALLKEHKDLVKQGSLRSVVKAGAKARMEANMRAAWVKVLSGVGWFLLIVVLGAFVFMSVERLSPVDAFYLTVVSSSTVGYGDVHPESEITRAFAILFLPMSTLLLAKIISDYAEMRVEARTMQRQQRILNAAVSKEDFEEMDRDGDGKVTKLEFLIRTLIVQGRVTEEDVNDILHRFKQLDEDNDGEFGHEVMS